MPDASDGPRNEAQPPGYRSWLAQSRKSIVDAAGVRAAATRDARASARARTVPARARRRAPTSTSSPRAAASSSSSRAVKHVVQRSNSRSSPSGSRTSERSCSTPVAGSKLSPSSRKRTANAAENAVSARRPLGRERAGDPAEDLELVAAARGARSRPGTGRWRRRTRRRTPARARRALRTCRRGRRRPAASRASRTKSGEWSTPTTSNPRRASASEWRPGPHPTSSTRMPRLEPERADEELDLLLRALRERVPQIRRPEELGDLVEPGAVASSATRLITSPSSWRPSTTVQA